MTRFYTRLGALLSDDEVRSAVQYWEDHANALIPPYRPGLWTGLPAAAGVTGAPAAADNSRVTHGRHCRCTSCARTDWTNPALVDCGMHGPSCPAVYAPLTTSGPPRSPVAVAGHPGGWEEPTCPICFDTGITFLPVMGPEDTWDEYNVPCQCRTYAGTVAHATQILERLPKEAP